MEVLILCITIIFVRIIDVSMGTVRMILMVKGRTIVASCIGFFEVLIWFLIIREALTVEAPSTLAHFFIALSFAGGFSIGSLIGGTLSNKFVSGNYGVQVVMDCRDKSKIDRIREAGYAVSVIDVIDQDEDLIDKQMLIIMIKKKRLTQLRKLIRSIDSDAFMVVNETKMVQNGFFK